MTTGALGRILVSEPPELVAEAARHRRALHVHCYRMLGSFEEAEDAVQETMVRAWRAQDTFTDRSGAGARPWLYRIATNVCLDLLRSRSRRPHTGSPADLPWLQPYPDRLLDELADPALGPDALVVARETIELAYLALVQLLPPRQRAVLLLREVLSWSAAETAAALDLSVAAVNSALQRARATLAQQPAGQPPTAPPSPADREVLGAFIAVHEHGDVEGALALLREDIRVTMPPHPWVFEGRRAMRGLLERAFDTAEFLGWRLVPAWANRQPAAISYALLPADHRWHAFKIDVLRLDGGVVREITTFEPTLVGAFGHPDVLEEPTTTEEIR
jgi:RNA polymerase sigma-70 factor (TIGR02960 family)